MSIEEWIEALNSVALIGTARRSLPPSSDRPAALSGLGISRGEPSAEVTLLDTVAVTSALRRSGASLHRDPGTAPAAPADDRPAPPARARQLLDLLLTQPPSGARLSTYALLAWLRAAEAHRFRVPHPALVPLLEKATGAHVLRLPLCDVLDSRGRWLAAANPAWAWAVAPPPADDAGGPVDPQVWAHGSSSERTLALRRLRATDPAGSRVLVESTWRTDPAPVRAELLGALEVGLSLADEPLLEQALDDRAASVRETAWRLLDALPDSARAVRLGALLRPLLSATGLIRRKVQVELPTAPTKEAARDGLAKAPRGRSERGFWLQRLAAGAPLATWTDATGLDPAGVVRTLEDEDALAGLRAAAVARRDPVWARALLDRTWDPVLARCLPHAEVADRVLARVAEVRSVPDLTSALRFSTEPWSEADSARIVARLARLERTSYDLVELVGILAERLHPSSAPAVARLVAPDAGPRDPLHQLAQHLSLVPTITEAFA